MKSKIILESLTFELPSYITHLTQDEIHAINSLDNDSAKIVAAGTHPADQKVMLILLSGIIMSFDAASYHIPRGRYIPSPDGKTVFLPNKDNRWPGTCPGFTLQSNWLISRSTFAISKAELLANNNSLGIIQF